MRIEFYIDPESGDPHIYTHGVNEDDVHEVLSNEGLRWREPNRIDVAVGRTHSGRILEIVYRQLKDRAFVISAYRPKKSIIAAYRQKMKKKK